jgi:hypothetical protein
MFIVDLAVRPVTLERLIQFMEAPILPIIDAHLLDPRYVIHCFTLPLEIVACRWLHRF